MRNRVSICWLKAYPAFVSPPPKTLQKIGGCVSGCTEIHTNTRSITQIHAEARIYTKNHAESRKVTQRTAFLGRFRGVLVYGRIGLRLLMDHTELRTPLPEAHNLCSCITQDYRFRILGGPGNASRHRHGATCSTRATSPLYASWTPLTLISIPLSA